MGISLAIQRASQKLMAARESLYAALLNIATPHCASWGNQACHAATHVLSPALVALPPQMPLPKRCRQAWSQAAQISINNPWLLKAGRRMNPR